MEVKGSAPAIINASIQVIHCDQNHDIYGIYFVIRILYIDGLLQERRNSSALAMELRLSRTNPSSTGVTSFSQ